MLGLMQVVDLALALAWFRIVWVSGQFTQFPGDPLWDGDRLAFNARMGWLMFIALALTLVAAAGVAAGAVAGRSFPSLRPWVYGVTLLLALLVRPYWREVVRVREEVRLRRH
jgi:hypothetical protein